MDRAQPLVLPARPASSSDRLSRLLFLEGHGNCRDCRQANFLAFDFSDQAEIDEMVVTLMRAFAAVALRQVLSGHRGRPSTVPA